MPLPVDLVLVAVTGTVLTQSGFPASGSITFTPSDLLTDTQGHVLVEPTPIRAQLVAGAFSVVLVATDQAQVRPLGWTYTVTIATAERAPAFQVQVPSTPTTTTLDALVPVATPSTPSVYVPITAVGQANGVASLNANKQIPSEQLPAGSGVLGITAADGTIVLGGTAANPTVKVGSGVTKGQLAAAVQTSLGLADSSLQSVPASVTTAVAPAFPLAGYGYHSASALLDSVTKNSTISEQWFARVWVPAGAVIAKVGAFVRVGGTVGAGGLNGFAIYSDAGILIWSSASDDTMWAAAGEVSKAVTPNIAAQLGGTWYRVAISVRGYSVAPSFPFVDFVDVSALSDAGNYRSRYRAAAYSAWPATVTPATDLQATLGYMVPLFLG